MTRVPRPEPTLGAAALLFSAGVLFGAALPATATSIPPASVDERSAWFFFERNATVAVVLYGGSLTFGVVTAVTLSYNGFAVGYAVAGGESVARSLLLLAPHAVVELPAFLLAGAAGLGLPAEVLRYLRGTQETLLRRSAVRRSVHRFLWAVALLGVAAWVEAVVTPAIAAAL